MDTVGERIQQARIRAVLNRSELAREAGLTYKGLLLIETGKTVPKHATVRRIAAALGIDPYTLVDIQSDD